MSSMRQQQQWCAKNIFCKQKSIDDKTPGDSHGSSGRKFLLRKQLSVDHVTSNLKHTTSSTSSNDYSAGLINLIWQNSSSENNNLISDSNLKITSATKKRSQFAATRELGASINKQDLLSSCLSKTMLSSTAGGEVTKAKDKINISLFISHDIADDGVSDNEHTPGSANNMNKSASVSTASANSKAQIELASNNKSSASVRRAQFQASRRIMSAPIRPINQFEDSKNKRKPARKKKVIRDKDLDDSQDELGDEIEELKSAAVAPPKPKKAPPMRSRSVLGCDQIGVETLVSMLNSGESDSEKEDGHQAPQPPPVKIEPPPQRVRANMLRKTVSFQEDDSQLQAVAATTGKDAFNFRRSSVVPFAGRMRNTRSLFGQEICNLYMNNNNTDKKIDEKNENDLNSSNQVQEEVVKEKPKLKKFESFDERRTQDILSQPREEECWRLYEKMKKTGLNISYDTILRGILKPSELRLLEKQKKFLGDIEEKSLDIKEEE